MLFLDTPSPSLSFIYQSLGCLHSLQPSRNPFEAPSTPALTAKGFVRWQTVQILLEPEEHVPFLQTAVKRFEIRSPDDGRPFPRTLPSASLPRTSDPEMTQWHEDMSSRLRIAAEAETERRDSNKPDDLESIAGSSISSQSVVDAAEYFQPRSTTKPYYASVNVNPVSPRARRPDLWQDGKSPSFRDQRSRSLQDQDTLWPRDGTTPTEQSYRRSQRRPRSRPSRVLSVTSASEFTDDSSVSASDATPSPEPVRRPQRHRESLYHNSEHHGRRHSAHEPFNSRDYVPSRPRPKQTQTLSPQFYTAQMPSGSYQDQRPSTSSQINGFREDERISKSNRRGSSDRDDFIDQPDGSETPRERPRFRFADDERDYFEDSHRR